VLPALLLILNKPVSDPLKPQASLLFYKPSHFYLAAIGEWKINRMDLQDITEKSVPDFLLFLCSSGWWLFLHMGS